MEINDRIFNLRKQLKLSRDAFGAKIGVTGHVVRNWDRQETNAADKPLILNMICEVYGVNREWLEYGTGEMFDTSSPSIIDQLAEKYQMSQEEKQVISNYLSLPSDERLTAIRILCKITSKD